MNLQEFNFDIPEKLIAKEPASPRDSSRLLIVKKNSIEDNIFLNLPSILRSNDLVIYNDSKVLRARLFGEVNNIKVEILVNNQLLNDEWLSIIKPAKKINTGDTIKIDEYFFCNVKTKESNGMFKVNFSHNEKNFFSALDRYGHMPLPPYIEKLRKTTSSDLSNYQTLFAKTLGSVAAPTAGFHFTKEIIDIMKSKGINLCPITLHVGAGTFLPVRVDNILDHQMHPEFGIVSEESAKLINETKGKGGRIISVGTTSLRLIESVSNKYGYIEPFEGSVSLFIYPSFKFKVTDILITNFHTPKSSLFMLVCAFMGINQMKKAYAHAVSKNYRFFSYGDANILFR
ncbi:tRNA preQ1(34) S-adenosylmethionine ribosyltransferase-isomerase QueA [Alphaproteobacteria bacterium]|nr:tRNA preQ1(34) S-adenosylmethionine ribosyltransferase-isomerase QueA [Alphaproteobacteria bacterium]